MPSCYLLAASAGSSLDQNSHNISLFNLVEQVNVRPGTPPGALVPLELHCYFRLGANEIGKTIRLRFVLVGPEGLETSTDATTHRVTIPRFRTRSLGIPVPPSLGMHQLRAEFQVSQPTSPEADPEDELGTWQRDPTNWPLTFVEMSNQQPPIH